MIIKDGVPATLKQERIQFDEFFSFDNEIPKSSITPIIGLAILAFLSIIVHIRILFLTGVNGLCLSFFVILNLVAFLQKVHFGLFICEENKKKKSFKSLAMSFFSCLLIEIVLFYPLFVNCPLDLLNSLNVAFEDSILTILPALMGISIALSIVSIIRMRLKIKSNKVGKWIFKKFFKSVYSFSLIYFTCYLILKVVMFNLKWLVFLEPFQWVISIIISISLSAIIEKII